MSYRATPRFWHCYRHLPVEVQRLADGCYELLRQDSRHPSLHLRKVGRLWSVRVGLPYRALAIEDGADLVWFWIGSHADYDPGAEVERRVAERLEGSPAVRPAVDL